MKFFTYLISIIAMVALAGLFIFKQPNGKTWLSIESFTPNTQEIGDKINVLSYKLNEIFNHVENKNSTVEVYRWKDSNGNWSYSDKPQISGDSEKVSFNAKDVTVLPATKVSSINSSTPTKKGDGTTSNTLIVTPSKVTKLYEDANNIQNLMDARQANIAKSLKKSID